MRSTISRHIQITAHFMPICITLGWLGGTYVSLPIISMERIEKKGQSSEPSYWNALDEGGLVSCTYLWIMIFLKLKSFLGVIFLKQHFYSSSWYQIGDGTEWDKAKTRYVYAVQSAESGKWKNAYLSTNMLPRRIIWERIWQDSRLIKTGSVSTELQSWSGKSTL